MKPKITILSTLSNAIIEQRRLLTQHDDAQKRLELARAELTAAESHFDSTEAELGSIGRIIRAVIAKGGDE